jgi:hypothetical protein
MQKNTGSGQLDLLFGHTDTALKNYFEERLKRPVSLFITENATSMLSARMRDGVLRIRLHRIFLNADSRVMAEIVSYLRNKRNPMPRFRSFVRDNKTQLPAKPPKKVLVRTAGKFHDLCGLYDEINKDYFAGAIAAAITWGARSPRSAVRKRTVGSYSERSNMIRINPVLDKKTVPRYYVAFIVYHEMLHAAMGAPLRGARRSVHSREFRAREKDFRDYEKVLAWEKGV